MSLTPRARHKGFLHPTTLLLHPQFGDLADFMRSLPQRMKQGEGTVIHKGRNELRLMDCGNRQLVVKAFRQPNVVNQFVYGTLRPSKAKRSYDNAMLLLSLGIGTPQPVGYYNLRGLLGLRFDLSYYVSLRSVCTHRYQELFERHFDYEEDVLRAIGRLTAKLHDNRLAHKDYGRANILFERQPDGEILLELVDLNRMAVGPLDVRAGCKNFERLPATPQMHRWMAEAYAEARGFDADECYRLMTAFRATQDGKIDGKY
ncbi:MAG: lipopolysaccharide kinase InaA family protein [Bacteroidales bacterium]|nr:lipopolysaccharide kinase InaA family protein [Bacteroidales bacterium]